MRIAILARGGVGVVTGICVVETDRAATCIDHEPRRIIGLCIGLCIVLCIGLNIGMAPFRKPGLDVLVLDTVRQRRPSFAADPCEALREA